MKNPKNLVEDAAIEDMELRTKEILSREVVLQSFPDMMRVVLTGRCNIECVMCPFRNTFLRDAPDHILRQVPLFYPYLRSIQWEGGEVFVHRMFYDLVHQAARHPHLKQAITTNGLLLNQDWFNLIAQSNIALSISTDGATRETYESIRKGGQWDLLTRNLEGLGEAFDRRGGRLSTQLNVVLMRSNIHELPLFVKFAKRYRFMHIGFTMMKVFDYIPEVHGENLYAPENADLLAGLIRDVPVINRLCAEQGIGCSWQGLRTIQEIVEKEPALAGIVRENGMRVEKHVFGDELAKTKESEAGMPAEKLHCVLPWRSLYVHTSGVSVDCSCIPEVKYTPDFNLLAFWNSTVMRHFREKIIRGSTDWCGMNCLLGREGRLSQQMWEESQDRVPVCSGSRS